MAGGLGTCVSEESYLKPKPLIEIGDQPTLWHITKYYSSFGFHNFVICCGYKSLVTKEYFAEYNLRRSDVTFGFSNESRMTVHENVEIPRDTQVKYQMEPEYRTKMLGAAAYLLIMSHKTALLTA